MKNTILIILLTAIFSAFCFPSCKNTEKDEPNGNSMVCDPRTYLYDEEAFDLSGFLVVKFKNPEYIHYLPIRNFIGWKDNAYYIPFFDWKLPFFNSFDNNPFYHHIYDEYYAVDWTVLFTTGIFSNYESDTRFVNENIVEKKQMIMRSSKSNFAIDMQHLKISDCKIDDYTTVLKLKEIANKPLDNNMECIGENPFSYIQYVFINDLLKSQGMDDEIKNLIKGKKFYDTITLMATEKDAIENIETHAIYDAHFYVSQEEGLLPVLSRIDAWHSIMISEKLSYNLIETESAYKENAQKFNESQEEYLEILRALLKDDKIELPQSML